MRPRQPAGAAILRPEKTEAIIAAFFAELGKSGYGGLTMDRVAERAGVGKAALYRRWPSKKEMLIDLVGQFATKAVLPPDTGSLRGDIQAITHDAIAVLANPLVRSVIQSLVTEAHRSPDLGAVLTERFINPRREAGAQMLRRAVDRGEVRPDSDLELAPGPYRRSPLSARRDPRRRVPTRLHTASHRRGSPLPRRDSAARQWAIQVFELMLRSRRVARCAIGGRHAFVGGGPYRCRGDLGG